MYPIQQSQLCQHQRWRIISHHQVARWHRLSLKSRNQNQLGYYIRQENERCKPKLMRIDNSKKNNLYVIEIYLYLKVIVSFFQFFIYIMRCCDVQAKCILGPRPTLKERHHTHTATNTQSWDVPLRVYLLSILLINIMIWAVGIQMIVSRKNH